MKTLLGTTLLVVGALLAPLVTSVKIELENLPTACDFRRCARVDPKKINVHLVPHTHDDVGWVNTVEQYYTGLHTTGVQYILDSVVQSLIRNKERRFIYVETAFFWRWWTEQHNNTQAIVKELVNSGQLEFINGGWSMSGKVGLIGNNLLD